MTQAITDEQEDLFIQRVRENPVIFDPKHYKYRDVQFKEKLWMKIAEEFGVDKYVCKRKWRHLRDGYQRYKKTHKKEFRSAEGPKVTKYNRFRFLDNVFSPRRHQDDEDNSNGTEEMEEDDIDSNTNVKQEADVIEPLLEFEHRNVELGHYNSENMYMNKVEEKKDDVDFFCLHIAEVLRKLPPVEKTKAKKHLSDVLFEYELMAAQSAAQTPSTSGT